VSGVGFQVSGAKEQVVEDRLQWKEGGRVRDDKEKKNFRS
jgi:hypothetical protein